MITITNSEGSGSETGNVREANIQTHIAARDAFAHEAEILKCYSFDENMCTYDGSDPVGWISGSSCRYVGEIVSYEDPEFYGDSEFIFSEPEFAELSQNSDRVVERIKIRYLTAEETEDE